MRKSLSRWALAALLAAFFNCCGAAAADKAPLFRGVIVLIGPPGSGKSTQAEFLKKKYKIPAISASELLKREIGKKSPLGKSLKISIESGELVADDVMNSLVRSRVQKKDTLNGFIMDGYPRTAAQARYLDMLVMDRDLPLPIVINLEVPDETVLARMADRGRADDQPEIMKRRLSEYREEIQPILEYWKEGRVFRVDATQTPEAVFSAVDEIVSRASKQAGLLSPVRLPPTCYPAHVEKSSMMARATVIGPGSR